MKIYWLLGQIFVMLISACQLASSENNTRSGKFVSMFQVVKFPNDPCIGSEAKNGTCFTSSECSSKKGNAAGTCASGFGVCCTFVLGCGGSSSENCTYFEKAGGSSAGLCRASICKMNSNICQLRLDFNSFVITGPSTLTDSGIKALFGQVVEGGKDVSTASQCLTDIFTIDGTNNVPVLCGKLTGQHIYIEASPSCNSLNFNLGATGVGASIVQRDWTIKVSQFSCEYANRAPAGCLQYYFGSSTGQVTTFNFEGTPPYHLANQQQSICVRREKGNCRICWSAVTDTDFQLSGKTNDLKGYITATQCCAYKKSGQGTLFDCVMIPGASDSNNPGAMLSPSICGRSKGLVKSMGTTATTICSKRTPFQITFLSNNWEFAGTNAEAIKSAGFKLAYFQKAC